MLLWLMNMGFAGGTAAAPVTSTTGYAGWQSAVIFASSIVLFFLFE